MTYNIVMTDIEVLQMRSLHWSQYIILVASQIEKRHIFSPTCVTGDLIHESFTLLTEQ